MIGFSESFLSKKERWRADYKTKLKETFPRIRECRADELAWNALEDMLYSVIDETDPEEQANSDIDDGVVESGDLERSAVR